MIKLDAAIEHLGLTADGAMDTPKGPNTVAWYRQGVMPGEIGSAVIAGHFGWKNGIPAVFDTLNRLRRGDKLAIIDDKGMTTNFVVRNIKSFSETDNTTTVFTSNDSKAHLNLITCSGVWNKVSGRFPNRLVVFSDKE